MECGDQKESQHLSEELITLIDPHHVFFDTRYGKLKVFAGEAFGEILTATNELDNPRIGLDYYISQDDSSLARLNRNQ